MTGTELYSAISIQTYERAREEQQKLATIAQRLGDVALMDEATREQWVSQQVSLSTTLKHEQQQQLLMQDLRDLNSRIAAQRQGCAEDRRRSMQPCRPTAPRPPSARSLPVPNRPK